MPVPTFGYPDWQRLVDWNDSALVDVESVFTGGSTVYGPLDVRLWHSVSIRAVTTLGPHDFILTWYVDEAATQQVGGRFFSVRSGQEALVSFPNQARFLFVSAQDDGVAGRLHSLRVVPTNRVMTGPLLTTNAPLIHEVDNPIAAGATETVDFSYWYTGPAHVVVRMIGQPGFFLIRKTSTLGVIQRVWQRGVAADTDYDTTIFLPGARLDGQAVNLGGGAGNWTMLVYPDFFRP